MKSGIEGVMDEWRQMQERINKLQKENAELRECLKEAISLFCGDDRENCCNLKYGVEACDHGPNECDVKKWRAALKGGNHAND